MTDLTQRYLGRRILLLLLPLGIIAVFVANAHPPELSSQQYLGGRSAAQVLPSGEVVRHPDAAPDPFVSRPSWALLPGLDALWEFQEASGYPANGTPMPMPPVDAVPRVVESEAGVIAVRVDYPDGSYYESIAEQSDHGTRDWTGFEFVSSTRPGTVQFVTNLDDERHPLLLALSEGTLQLPPDVYAVVIEEIDDETTVNRLDYSSERVVHSANVEGEVVTYELSSMEFRQFRPFDTISYGVYVPAERHVVVAGFLRILPWLGAALAGVGLASFVVNLAGVDRRSQELAERIMPSPAGQLLVERWLKRSRYFRFVGATVAALLYTGRHLYTGDQRNGSYNIDLVDLTFWMFVGVAIGGAVAELHLVRRRRDRSTLADLQPRSIVDYTTVRDRAAMVFVAVVAATLVLLRITNVLAGSLVWSVAAGALIVAAYGFQHIVARRRRPAVPGPLRSADDVLRFLASTRGFGRPAAAAALFALAQAFWWDSAPDWMAWASLLFVVTGIVWFASGSERRLDSLVETWTAT